MLDLFTLISQLISPMLRRFLIASVVLWPTIGSAGNVFVDLDPSTLSIDSSIDVLPGSMIRIDLVFVPETLPGPSNVDAFGVDLAWGTSGDTAELNVLGVTTRAPGCSIFNGCTDIVSGAGGKLPIEDRNKLQVGSLPAPSGFSSNLGGVGVYDQTRVYFSGVTNPINVSFPIAQVEFEVTGEPGALVSMIPAGILNSTSPPFELTPNSSFLIDQTGDNLISATGQFSSIRIVPEPIGNQANLLFFLLSTLMIYGYRR